MTWTGVASGVLLLGLGVAILLVRPRRTTSLLLGAFCACFGITFVCVNFAGMYPDPSTPPRSLMLAASSAEYVSTILLVTLALRLPSEAPRRRLLVVPAAAGAAFTTLASWANPYPLLGAPDGGRLSGWFFNGATVFFLSLVVLRARSLSERQRGQGALMSAALALLPAMNAGALLISEPSEFVPNVMMIVMLVGVASLWLAVAAQGASPRASRNVAWTILATILLGLLAAASGVTDRLHVNAVARAAGVMILAYAILRHQLLGIDVKLKWTLEQSTVAAIFVAVFFIVSETAQQAFAGTRMGPYLGIAAAGMLLFAIHPLQHLAQRVADRAMPGVKAVGEMTSDDRLELYREQLRIAWSDGNLSADERRLLAGTRVKLGISAEDAARVEEEVAH